MAEYKEAGELCVGDVWINRDQPRNRVLRVVEVSKRAVRSLVVIIGEDVEREGERYACEFFTVNRVELVE